MSNRAQVEIGGIGGSVVSFTPLTKTARAWFDANVESESWQWMGSTLAVDHRMARDLIDGLHAEGIVYR